MNKFLENYRKMSKHDYDNVDKYIRIGIFCIHFDYEKITLFMPRSMYDISESTNKLLKSEGYDRTESFFCNYSDGLEKYYLYILCDNMKKLANRVTDVIIDNLKGDV